MQVKGQLRWADNTSSRNSRLNSNIPSKKSSLKSFNSTGLKFRNLNSENLKNILENNNENNEIQHPHVQLSKRNSSNSSIKHKNSTELHFEKTFYLGSMFTKENPNEECISNKKIFSHSPLTCRQSFREVKSKIEQPQEKFKKLKMEILRQDLKVKNLLGDLKRTQIINQDLLKVYIKNLRVIKIKKWRGLIEN